MHLGRADRARATRSTAIIRKNPRKLWYSNLKEVTTNGDFEVTFVLGRPQPSFLAMLAGGYSPVYSCHVPDRVMRSKPIGTGPFKVVEFKRNESIKLVKNPDYWKKGRPYLDAIDWKIVPNRSTRMLGFQSGEFDMTFDSDVTFPLLKDVKAQQARRRLRGAADQRQLQPPGQSRQGAVQQSARSARRWCWRSTARRSTTS